MSQESDLKITLIPHTDVVVVWDNVSSMLKRATDLSRGRYRLKDLKDKLTSGEFQLWVVFEPGFHVVAAITSTFTIYPQCKALHGQFLGGERLDEWKAPFCQLFDRWGRENGCSMVEFTGRPGWGRALADQGYKEIYRVYQRDLR